MTTKKRPNSTALTESVARRSKAELLADELIHKFEGAKLLETSALGQLDQELALRLVELLPRAIAQATAGEKPDTRLLRLIVRYASTTRRLLLQQHTDPKPR